MFASKLSERVVFIWPQLKSAIYVIIGAIPAGMHYGWTAPILPILHSKDTPIPITHTDEIWFEIEFLLAGLFTIPLTGYLLNKFGPRRSILIGAIITLLTFVLLAFARNTIYLHCSRILAGAISDITYVATPMYLAEISSKNIRGVLTSLNDQLLLLGVVIIFGFVSFLPLYAYVVFGAVLSVIQIITAYLVPESPYYLVRIDKYEDAKLALAKLRTKDEDIDKEFVDIALTVQRQQQFLEKPVNLFVERKYRRLMVIVTTLAFFQMLGGYMSIVMDLHTILSKADYFVFDYQTWAFLFSILSFFGAFICSITVDMFGRRQVLMVSSIITSSTLIMVGVYFHLKDIGLDVSSINWLIPVIMMFYASIYRTGLATVPLIYYAEVFPDNVKAYGLPYCDGLLLIFGSTSILVYYACIHLCGLYLSFYIFGFIVFAGIFFVWFFLPETKGKTLDEIQIMFENKKLY